MAPARKRSKKQAEEEEEEVEEEVEEEEEEEEEESVRPSSSAASFKEGQKKPTPPCAEATRVFYESLYKQNPKSTMAMTWCVAHGVLSDLELKKALKVLGNE
ncbi:hypothetical protein BASA81_010805 [Batrachochytrium salamandrivorans]|nr:hypothetical protein BASA81_010805 [Batrachochytrium salamandrivorans]